MISEHFPGDGFPTLARGAPILLGFPRFRSLFGPDFRATFPWVFGGDFSVHFALHLVVDFGLSLAADCFLNNAEDVTAFTLEIVFDVT
jgi:hypothetical protein